MYVGVRQGEGGGSGIVNSVTIPYSRLHEYDLHCCFSPVS